ncbi:MAG: hypothetical protein H7A23_03725 [Leptospiraceae bacterium]|nr:hypothetical protein [Leptospiraceae bacterium]MCP5493640.1 hypothetical protein [Leptospiraceae bacterium]
MKIFVLSILCIAFISCGNNTDTPVLPFIFLNPVGTPQIVRMVPAVSPIETPGGVTETGVNVPGTDLPSPEAIPYKPEFILKYYVTNQEQQFIGYNLYITTSTPSLAETMQGASTYLEDGVPPSFEHSPVESSTNILIKKIIANRIPPPGVFPFQKCEVYTFTLRALLSNGLVSNPSAPVSICSSLYPGKCPIGTSCNPATCTSTSSCPANCPSGANCTCPVGTACNPCLFPDLEGTGCECPEGSSPPGCNT